MRLIVKSPVWDDLREIGLWIAKENPDAAERFLSAAEQTFQQLKLHPGLGRLRSFTVPGVRSWPIPGFKRYLVFYLPTPKELQILAVIHGARDLATALAGRME